MHERTRVTPRRSPPAARDTPAQAETSVRRMQQQLGNRTVQKLFAGGFEVADRDDPRERDAQSIAGGASPAEPRTPSGHWHPLDAGGTPLAPDLRALLEHRVGSDLGAVRVHRDPEAADALEAKAFTAGSDIVLGKEAAAAPSLRLLSHEAAHAARAGKGEGLIFRQPYQDIIDRYGGSDTVLGVHLATLAARGQYALVSDVIAHVGYFSRDDVALAMLTQLSVPDLIRIARDSGGQSMLRVARDEVTGGWERAEEAEKGQLISAVLGDVLSRRLWNRHRIEAIKEASPNDLESLARLFDDDQIVDDGTVQSRLESILNVTEHFIVVGLRTAISFGDTGFRGDQSPNGDGFRDPHPSSRNQVGHFLTAVGLRFDPQLVSRPIPFYGRTVRDLVGAPPAMPDEEVALRLTIGHEKAPDPPEALELGLSVLFAGIGERFLGTAPEGETEEQRNERVGRAMVDETRRRADQVIAMFRAQFAAATDADIAAWNETLGRIGTDPAANTAAIEGPDSPLNRIPVDPALKGNSRQDLRLSLMGWRLGQMIRNGEFGSRADVAAWIRANLGTN